jgi:transposase
LHAVQIPVQTLLQQTLLTQNPEAQEAAVVQAAPCDSLPQLPVVVLQVAGVAQSVLAAQVVLQAVVAHPKGSHSDEVTVLQLPAPSHVRAGVSVETEQVAAAQVVVLL